MYDPNAKPEEPQLSRRQQIKQAQANRMNNQAVKKHGEEQVQAFYNAQQNPAPAPALNANQQANQQAVQQHGEQAVQDFYSALQGNNNQPAPKSDPNEGASKKTEQPAVQPPMPAELSNLFGMALAGGGTPFGGGFYNPAPFGNQMMFGGYSPMGMGGFGGYNPMAQVPMGMGALLGGVNRAGWGY